MTKPTDKIVKNTLSPKVSLVPQITANTAYQNIVDSDRINSNYIEPCIKRGNASTNVAVQILIQITKCYQVCEILTIHS